MGATWFAMEGCNWFDVGSSLACNLDLAEFLSRKRLLTKQGGKIASLENVEFNRASAVVSRLKDSQREATFNDWKDAVVRGIMLTKEFPERWSVCGEESSTRSTTAPVSTPVEQFLSCFASRAQFELEVIVNIDRERKHPEPSHHIKPALFFDRDGVYEWKAWRNEPAASVERIDRSHPRPPRFTLERPEVMEQEPTQYRILQSDGFFSQARRHTFDPLTLLSLTSSAYAAGYPEDSRGLSLEFSDALDHTFTADFAHDAGIDCNLPLDPRWNVPGATILLLDE